MHIKSRPYLFTAVQDIIKASHQDQSQESLKIEFDKITSQIDSYLFEVKTSKQARFYVRKLELAITNIESSIQSRLKETVSTEWIAGAFSKGALTPSQKVALQKSDAYIKQIKKADLLVIGAPMYNYGMPGVLKAWIDQIARINKTFSFDLSRGDEPIESILHDKKLVVFTSSGEFDFAPGGSRQHKNHLISHIKSCAHYLEVSSDSYFHHVSIEYQEFKDERHELSKKEAYAEIPNLIEQLTLEMTEQVLDKQGS